MIWIEKCQSINKDKVYYDPSYVPDMGFKTCLHRSIARICKSKNIDINKLDVKDDVKAGVWEQLKCM